MYAGYLIYSVILFWTSVTLNCFPGYILSYATTRYIMLFI